jgi:hypothetical protein
MPSWKKVITSGSDAALNSLFITNNLYVTGGLLVTQSYISTVDYIDFTKDIVTPFAEGRIHWDDDRKTLQIDTETNNFSISTGHVNVLRGRNTNLFTLTKGTVVYINGSSGQFATFATASYIDESNSAYTIGILPQDISTNQYGYAVIQGEITDINTNGFTPGTLLYLSSSGQYTDQVPVSPNHTVRLGQVVVASTSGILQVKVDNGYEIGELHNVLESNKQTGDLLIYDSGSGLYRNSKILSGSYGISGSLNVSEHILGSFTGSMSATGVELSQSILTNITVGALNSGTTLTSGTNVESILRQMLITYIAPTLGTVNLKNNGVTVLNSSPTYEVSSSLTFNTASFTATADNPNGRFAYSASFTASGADTGNFNYFFGNDVLGSTNDLGLGSSRVIDVTTITGNSKTVTFSIRGVNPQNGSIITGTNRTITYVYPIFYGMTAVDYSTSGNLSDLVSGITKLVQTKGTKTLSISGTSAFVYFAYPAVYGNLTSIKDGNPFEILPTFTLYTRNQNGAPSNPWTNIPYNIYKNNNLTTVIPAQNYVFTF